MRVGEAFAGLRKWAEQGGCALLPLRIVVGFGFVAHGYAKLGRGPAGFAPVTYQTWLGPHVNTIYIVKVGQPDTISRQR